MLDMYRQEALAARQESAYGAMLEVRPFLFTGSAALVMAIATLLMVLLLQGREARTTRVPVVPIAGAAAGANGVELVVTGPAPAPPNGQRALLRSAAKGMAPVAGLISTASTGLGARMRFSVDGAEAPRLREAVLAGDELSLEWRQPEQAFGQWLLAQAWRRSGTP